MPIDTGLFNRAPDYTKTIPDLSDIFQLRQNYQTGELRQRQLQNSVTEEEAGEAAKRAYIQRLRDKQEAKAGLTQQAPQVAAQVQTPAPIPQLGPMGGQMGAAMGQSMSAPMAPVLPPGIQLAKPPDDYHPDVKLPGGMSPAATQRANELVTAAKGTSDDFEDRVRSAYGKRQEMADVLPWQAAAMMSHQSIGEAEINLNKLETARLTATRRNVAIQSGQELRALQARLRLEKDPDKQAEIRARTAEIIHHMKLEIGPQATMDIMNEAKLERLQATLDAKAAEGDAGRQSREDIAAGGNASRERIGRGHDATSWTNTQNNIQARLTINDQKQADTALENNRRDAQRLTFEISKALLSKDPVDQRIQALHALQQEEASIKAHWYSKPVIIPPHGAPTPVATPAPRVTNMRPGQKVDHGPGAPDAAGALAEIGPDASSTTGTPIELDSRPGVPMGGASFPKVTVGAPVPAAGKSSSKTSGVSGAIKPTRDFPTGPNPDDGTKPKAGLETPEKIQSAATPGAPTVKPSAPDVSASTKKRRPRTKEEDEELRQIRAEKAREANGGRR